MVSLAHAPDTQSTSSDDETNEIPQRAKRIARPAHWKKQRLTAAAQAPQTTPVKKAAPAAMVAPTLETQAPAATAPENWQHDSGFIMRALACMCVLNFLLFTVFPENPLEPTLANETVLTTSDRSILPKQIRASREEAATLYAPAAQRIQAPVAYRAPTRAGERTANTPRWLREPAY